MSFRVKPPKEYLIEPVHRTDIGVFIAERLTKELRHAALLIGGDNSGGLDAYNNAVVIVYNVHNNTLQHVFDLSSAHLL